MSSKDESESLNVNPTSAMCMEFTTGPEVPDLLWIPCTRDDLPWDKPSRIIHYFFNINLSEIWKTNFFILKLYFYS